MSVFSVHLSALQVRKERYFMRLDLAESLLNCAYLWSVFRALLKLFVVDIRRGRLDI